MRRICAHVARRGVSLWVHTGDGVCSQIVEALKGGEPVAEDEKAARKNERSHGPRQKGARPAHDTLGGRPREPREDRQGRDDQTHSHAIGQNDAHCPWTRAGRRRLEEEGEEERKRAPERGQREHDSVEVGAEHTSSAVPGRIRDAG